jgi:acid phosphatase class B
MAVQKIKSKRIVKYDTSNPNFKQPEQKVEEINGNLKEDEDIYGEKKHTYTPDSNGNLKMEELMGKMLNKLNNFDTPSQTGIKAVEVDIKREIAIGKVDSNAVKSQEFKGKVMNKKDKLKALRNRRK